MSLKIFITGKPKVGKSTLIKELVEELKDKFKIAGFFTPEILKNGKRIGFKVVDVFGKREGTLASEKITKTKFGKYFIDLESFESFLDGIEKEVEYAEIVVIDEIGRMELFSKKFVKFLKKVLESDKILIATLHRKLKKNFSKYGIIFELTRENKAKLKQEILEYLEYKI